MHTLQDVVIVLLDRICIGYTIGSITTLCAVRVWPGWFNKKFGQLDEWSAKRSKKTAEVIRNTEKHT